jgi:hypothetical protein
VIDRVHADAVAEQRAAGAAPGRIDCDDRNIELIAVIETEAADDFIGQRRFARAAGAGDAEYRD